jgi:hypothetical protein
VKVNRVKTDKVKIKITNTENFYWLSNDIDVKTECKDPVIDPSALLTLNYSVPSTEATTWFRAF